MYFKFLETKPLSILNEDTMAKKQMSPSSASEHAPLLDSAATRLVKIHETGLLRKILQPF